jgi:hypothetical protein
MVVETPELTELEMIEILKGIAREGGNAAARIAAIKMLRTIAAERKPAEHEGLYDVSNPGRIRALPSHAGG